MQQDTKEEVYAEWERVLTKMDKWKFNAIRLYTYPNMNLASVQRLDYVFIDDLISLIKSHGMATILEIHHAGYDTTGAYITGYFGSDQWIQDWRDLATRYKNNPNVIAFELYNEPWPLEEWDPVYVTEYNDILKANARCTDAIRAIDPTRTVIWADPLLSNNIPYYDFSQSSIIEEYRRYAGNMWFAFHRYPPILPASGEPWTGIQVMFNSMDYVIAKGFNVWLGEFGPHPSFSDVENREFVLRCINFCMSRNLSFSLWEYRIDHHCTPGLYDDVLALSDYTAPPPFTPTPPIDLPTAGGIALALADVALIGYYAYTKFVGK
jgi:endoglucanase